MPKKQKKEKESPKQPEEKTILELGCGLGTKELIQKFGKVISFETAVDDKWMNITIEDNKDATNWKYSFKPLSYYL